MGAVSAWIAIIIGLFILGATYLFTYPMFDMIFTLAEQNGVQSDFINFLKATHDKVPILIGIAFLVYGIVGVLRREEKSVVVWR